MRRRKPRRLPLQPKSDRIVRRMAAAMAFAELDWSKRDDYEKRAQRILETLELVSP